MLATLVVPGCGETPVKRIPVSGTVTFEGKPVSEGLITFEPLLSAGMMVPTGYGRIDKGAYDTGEFGPTDGDYNLRIMGQDRSLMKDPTSIYEIVPQLFPEYVTQVTIPADGHLDVEVPSRKK